MLSRMAVLLMLSPATVGAQEVIDLSSFERCRACNVAPLLDLRLGDPDLPGGIESEWAEVVFDEVHGGYAVYHRGGTHVQLFDSLGAFQRVLGREGGGPGELRMLSSVAFADGNIVMLEVQGRKFVVMNRAGKLIADTRIDLRTGDLRVISADTVVIGSMDFRPDLVGYPLHLVSLSDGEVLRHFGSLEGEWNAAAEPFAEIIRLGQSLGDRSVWRGYVSRLRLEEWGLDGSLIQVISGDFDWFPPMILDHEGPASLMAGFDVDREERLWLLARVPDPNWRSVPRGAGGETLLRQEDYDRYWDVRLDVFDLRTQEHLGTFRWDESRVFLANRRGNTLVYLVEYDEHLVPRVALYRLDIKASPQ